MKKYTNSFSRAIIILLAFVLASCIIIKPVPGNKYVVLLVNTSDINPGADPKDFCSFPVQHGVSDSEYKTHVFRGDHVAWMGLSTTSADDEVVIESIILDEDPGTLGLTDGVNDLQGQNGVVNGTISEDAKRGKVPYFIEFTVITEDGSNTFTLDPILRVH